MTAISSRRAARGDDLPPVAAPLIAPATLAAAARKALAGVTAAGVEAYDRDRMLPRLAKATPAELADGSVRMRRTILARLCRALRSERNRGRAGHWTYDLNRHIGLVQACRAERAAIAGLGRGNPAAGQPSRVR